MAEKKEKRYVSDNARLMAEWDEEKNTNISPTLLTLGSHKKVWWKCNEGHEWQAAISDRYSGTRCPYCAGTKVLQGYNDLETINPVLAIEWNYKMNVGLTPTDVMPNSGRKVWWKCKEGHEWNARIAHRNKGIGCPYCAGQVALGGINDLFTVNPVLSKEWYYEKNGTLTPKDVKPCSGRKVWWKCSKGHKWQAVIATRNKGSGCPVCNSERQTSFPEYAFAYYLGKCGVTIIHPYREKGYELDIYIPSMKIAIEYDGYYWHKDKLKKDLEKNLRCKNDGIRLYRIRENLLSLNDTSIDYIVSTNITDLQQAIVDILNEIIGVRIEVDLTRDAIDIENLMALSEKENSVLFSNPQLANEWNNSRNGQLKPENFSMSSNRQVWWLCQKGHEWQARIADRNRGDSCPFCSGLYPIKGENDLQTVNPSLASEWNYKRNNDLKPENFTPNSSKKVWWICGKGHEWQAIIKHRNHGSGCPYCSGRCAIGGNNDLQTVAPSIANEWNYKKNAGLTPKNVKPNSGKKVWWICGKGHEWQARIADRNRGNGCPFCSGLYPIKGENDLQTVNPSLASEWNYKRNNDLKPENFTPNSGKKVWWICEEGHEWIAEIKSRNRGNGCPECAKQKRKKKIT